MPISKLYMSLSAEPPRLLHELRESRRDLVKTIGPIFLVATVGFLIAFYFVEPPPPQEVVIVAGHADGNYYAAAQRYARLFEENGVTLTVRETAGSVENYELLLNDDSVQLAIVQGGTAPQVPGIEQLESIATLYLEPVWVFYRSGQSITRLADLKGKRIAVGDEGVVVIVDVGHFHRTKHLRHPAGHSQSGKLRHQSNSLPCATRGRARSFSPGFRL